MAQKQINDPWTHESYSASASFVPELTSKIFNWLNPRDSDIVLDLGCGDGPLTAKIKKKCVSVEGFDASANLINAAIETYGAVPNLRWHVQDCRYLELSSSLKHGGYTKVFSNAALHWILRDPNTRMSVVRAAYKALRPGGEFVFEMGGAGNVAEIHSALLAALVHQGLTIEAAREASPWFFPSEELMRQMLEEVGFVLEKSEVEYRPTKATAAKDGGLEGWVRLMGANFLEALTSTESREAAIKEVCDVLKSVMTREEDGSVWLGYVRLRALATKPL